MSPQPQPRERILDVYGAFARRVGGWLAVADLISLMALFDVDEQAVRSATSRMKRSGLLITERRGASAGYRLSPETVELLADGDRRIFRAAADESVHEGWVLAIFSVPETQRKHRYLIRSRLSWLGFGQVASGVMLAPLGLRREAEHMLQRTHLDEFVTLWESTLVIRHDERAMVARAWDLTSISDAHHDFIAEFEPVARRWRTPADASPASAFVDYVDGLSHWRHLPYLDPGLPQELLPATWPGAAARALFSDIVELLEYPAFQHFVTVVGASAQVSGR